MIQNGGWSRDAALQRMRYLALAFQVRDEKSGDLETEARTASGDEGYGILHRIAVLRWFGAAVSRTEF